MWIKTPNTQHPRPHVIIELSAFACEDIKIYEDERAQDYAASLIESGMEEAKIPYFVNARFNGYEVCLMQKESALTEEEQVQNRLQEIQQLVAEERISPQ